MCDNELDMEKSKEIFLKCKTVVEFMEIWSKFYENEICIPTYHSKFVGAEDNPQATRDLGKKLKEIARRGFLATDSQVNIPGNQKSYIVGYLPNKMAKLLSEELNRYSGIVAFYSDIKDFREEDEDVFEHLFVTYDANDDEILKSAKNNKMSGVPFTTIPSYEGSFDTVREWMSKEVKKKINIGTYKYFVCISPCFDSEPEFLFDKVLEVLRSI